MNQIEKFSIFTSMHPAHANKQAYELHELLSASLGRELTESDKETFAIYWKRWDGKLFATYKLLCK